LAGIGDQQAPVRAKFVALGVAAEIIVIVQNEDPSGWIMLAVKICR
jgi:hypothetical protein